jgi:hypothetical protein
MVSATDSTLEELDLLAAKAAVDPLTNEIRYECGCIWRWGSSDDGYWHPENCIQHRDSREVKYDCSCVWYHLKGEGRFRTGWHNKLCTDHGRGFLRETFLGIKSENSSP